MGRGARSNLMRRPPSRNSRAKLLTLKNVEFLAELQTHRNGEEAMTKKVSSSWRYIYSHPLTETVALRQPPLLID